MTRHITTYRALTERRRNRQAAARLAEIRPRADRLRHSTDRQLAAAADNLRESLCRSEFTSDDTFTEAFALAFEALRRTLNVELYEVQLLAASALARGEVAEMQTGEGKTLSAVPAAILRGIMGQGVHVVTTNAYLADRDFQLLRPVYELLGLSVGLLPEGGGEHEKRAPYQCDITYGTGYEFGFDYLRDQVSLRNKASQSWLGQSVLEPLRGGHGGRSTVIQRSRAFAIVDEIDHVLIDDAGSPLILSATPQRIADDADVYRLVSTLVWQLQPSRDFCLYPASGHLELTARGKEWLYAAEISIPVKQLRRSWTEYVEQALRAQYLFHRDVHYIVTDQAIQIVDSSTGRIFSDRTWRDGLHQAIEAKENLPITAEKSVLAQVTRQRFFRLYERLAGMTGTAQGCEREFRTVYNVPVTPIPVRSLSRRVVLPLRAFCSREAKWAAILRDVETVHRRGQPVLVGTRSIADSEQLADALRQRGLPFQLLNGRQDAEEAEIIGQAGQQGAITLTTNLAGRGTDIRLGMGVPSLGGMHVMVTEPHESSRVDRQLIGRCGRQGDAGSAQVYLSSDDALIRQYGAWLIHPMARLADRNGEVRTHLSGRLQRMQRAAERAQFSARAALFRRDLSRDSLVSQLEQES